MSTILVPTSIPDVVPTDVRMLSDLFFHAYGGSAASQLGIELRPADASHRCWVCGHTAPGFAMGPRDTFTLPLSHTLSGSAGPWHLCLPCYLIQVFAVAKHDVTLPVYLSTNHRWDHQSLPASRFSPLSASTASQVLTARGWAQLTPCEFPTALFSADEWPRPIQITVTSWNNSSWARVFTAPLYYGGPYLPVFLGRTGQITAVTRRDVEEAHERIRKHAAQSPTTESLTEAQRLNYAALALRTDNTLTWRQFAALWLACPPLPAASTKPSQSKEQRPS